MVLGTALDYMTQPTREMVEVKFHNDGAARGGEVNQVRSDQIAGEGHGSCQLSHVYKYTYIRYICTCTSQSTRK